MLEIEITPSWTQVYPGAMTGFLAMSDVANPQGHPALEARKIELLDRLRVRFSGYNRADLVALPTIQPYVEYYKSFKKTYHVLLQLETVIVKGKPIQPVSALVEAMLLAELKNQLLTAGHDLAALTSPVKVAVSAGAEIYLTLGGQQKTLKAGDMFMHDQQGIISSVIYGPDQRTRIQADTNEVIYTVYAPPGINEQVIDQHLVDIRDDVFLFSPDARVDLLKIYST